MGVFDGLGPALRKLREGAGLSQEEWARRAKVSAAMISRYERGSETPQIRSLARLLEAVGASVSTLADTLEGRDPQVSQALAKPNVVAAISNSAFTDPRIVGHLSGLAAILTADPSPKADAVFVESVAEAARQLAQNVIDKLHDVRRET